MANKTGLWITLGVIAGIIIVAIMAYSGIYNGLVNSDEGVKQAWADVQSSYQRRMDLIPNLVSTVQGSASFEKETLTEITGLRAQAVAAQQSFKTSQDPAQQIAATQSAESALSRLLVIVENYPQLTATEGFRDLQVQLEGTENRINVARDRYNDAVATYNRKVRGFPSNIVAGMSGFEVATPFQAAAGADVAPKVEFD
jgi:LemA protein